MISFPFEMFCNLRSGSHSTQYAAPNLTLITNKILHYVTTFYTRQTLTIKVNISPTLVLLEVTLQETSDTEIYSNTAFHPMQLQLNIIIKKFLNVQLDYTLCNKISSGEACEVLGRFNPDIFRWIMNSQVTTLLRRIVSTIIERV